MKLNKVIFQNYRCFEYLEIELDPRLTVIVGNNGAGKTAILDGIATILSKSFNYLSTSHQRFQNQGRGILDRDIRLLPTTSKIAKAVDFSYLRAESSVAVWDTWRSPTKNKIKPENLYGEKDLKNYLLDIIASYDIENARKLTPVFAYYDAGRASRENIERLRNSKINYAYPTAALMNSLTINQEKDSLREALEWFDKEEATELRREKESGDSYSNLQNVRLAIATILGEDYTNPRFNSKHKFVLTKKLAGGDTELSVLQLSQGYQSMLTLAMDFSRRLSIANEHLKEKALAVPSIMLIDEVDLHLHPSWQQKVLGDLMRTFPETQFIVTTHSPQVLTTVPSKCIRIIDGQNIYNAPAGSQGAEASRLLEDIFRVESRPPQDENTLILKEYQKMVYEDKWATEDAILLRKKLDVVFQGNEPELTNLDLYIDNRQWELGLEESE